MAVDLCIDLVAPEAPEGLGYQGNVELSWNEANDEPDCSGIAYYNVYRDSVFLGTSLTTSFVDIPLSDGTYVYEVIAVDRSPDLHESAPASLSVTLGSTGNPGNDNPGGGGESNTRYDDEDEDDESGEEKVIFEEDSSENQGDNVNSGDDTEKGLADITGAAFADGENGNAFVGLLFVLVIAGLLIFAFYKKKKKKVSISS